MNIDLKHIAELFQISGKVTSISAWGAGHINSTYKVECDSGLNYILQKVNEEVFPQPIKLMQNMVKVTKYIHEKVEFAQLVVPLIQAKTGEFWNYDGTGFWRMHPFVDTSFSYETAETEDISRKMGRTLGAFLATLHGFPVQELNITIPQFHDLRFRMHQFHEALSQSSSDRIADASKQISFVKDHAGGLIEVYKTALKNHPLRVTHNDTKLNNVLIGAAELGTVIDLDTVMPGFTFFDVGDALRSVAISAKEDDPDIDPLSLNRKNMKAFLEGYLIEAEEILTQYEIQVLPKSGAYMSFIMAVRFLTDYLNGDIYYKTTFPDHNLVRTKNQLKVCSLFREFENEITV